MTDETLTAPEVILPGIKQVFLPGLDFFPDGRVCGRGPHWRARNASRGICLERDPSLLAGQHFGRQKCHPGYRQVGSTDAGLEVERYDD